MLKFLNLEPEVFAINLQDRALYIAKLKKIGKGFYLKCLNETEIKPGIIKEGIIQDTKALSGIISLAFNQAKKKLGTKYVIVSLPEEKSFSQIISMPKMTKKELDFALPFELENYIPLPVNKTYIDFQIINGVRKNESENLHLLINAVPKTVVDSYVKCLKDAGLIPCVLELESQAVSRALTDMENTDQKSQVFIDLGCLTCNFIVCSSNQVSFTSSISISSGEIAKALPVKKAGGNEAKLISPALRDLSLQISKYIDFYNNGTGHNYFKKDGKIEKIVLTGPGANLKGLDSFLKKSLGIKVELANPLIGISWGKKFKIQKDKLPSFATVLGLAKRAAVETIK